MQQLFSEILKMSITASYCVIAVLLLRLILKRFPKIYSYVLWVVVFFRMVFPFSIKSTFSMLKPGTKLMHAINPELNSAFDTPGSVTFNVAESTANVTASTANTAVNASNAAADAHTVSAASNLTQNIFMTACVIWITVVAGISVYSVVSAFRLRKKLRNSVHFEANIYESDNISTPFVFGIIKPKIYLPANLSEAERDFVLKHELTHIRRKDYIIKPLAFFIVCLHWFNPFAWMAFYLMSKDMEMSCDESVIGKLSRQETADYSKTLLAIAAGKKFLGASPLAFSEGNVKDRIKNVLEFKKPVAWVTGLIVAVLVAVIAGLSLNPKDSGASERLSETIADAETLAEYESEEESKIESETEKTHETERANVSYADADTINDVIKEYYSKMESNYLFTNVKKAAIHEIVEIDFDYAKKKYLKYDNYVDEESKAYLVRVDYDVDREEWPYCDGIDYDILSLKATETGWKVSECVKAGQYIEIFIDEGYVVPDENVEAVREKYKYFYNKKWVDYEKTKILTMEELIEMSENNSYEDYNFNECSNGMLSSYYPDYDYQYAIHFNLEYQEKRYGLMVNYIITDYGMMLNWVSLSSKMYPTGYYLYFQYEDMDTAINLRAILDGYDFENNVSYDLPEEIETVTPKNNYMYGVELVNKASQKEVGEISAYIVNDVIRWEEDEHTIEFANNEESYNGNDWFEECESMEISGIPAFVEKYVFDNYAHSGLEDEELEAITDNERYDIEWKVFMARPGDDYGCVVVLNAYYYSKEDVLNIAKTLKFK
ncbi:MAG: hypothetical protein IJM37_11820 [Lachnospiraceae bacterium]|nr:hypothetical protein [Lachnospiraceae bacterium]